ncbi:uncharacterized protein [Periplaneta americana]|uniref:uncharacterized protein n=1 Tax=Periplaneta americana TaxID=6978 RepID=UPI0037E91D0F
MISSNVLDIDHNLSENSESVWGRIVMSDKIRLELSELKCRHKEDETYSFRRFFRRPNQELEKQICSPGSNVSGISLADNSSENGAVSLNVKTEALPVNVKNEKETEERGVEMCLDRSIGTGDLQSEVPHLVCTLNEQMATSEQLVAVSDLQLESILSKLSDTGLCHICALMCLMSPSEQNRLGSLVCQYLLVPRLQEKNREACSRAVVAALVEFTKTLPHLSCVEFFLPLLLSSQPLNEENTLLHIITEALSPQHKEDLLRSFLKCEPGRLEDWQLPFIQELLSSVSGDTVTQELVHLLRRSADDLATNICFAKLLISVIKQLGPEAPLEIKEHLSSAVNSLKSLFKKAAKKALQEL